MNRHRTTLRRWREERNAAYLIAAMARAESDAAKRALFAQLAAESLRQAAIVAGGIEPAPSFEPSLRARLIRGMINRLGPRAMRPILAASKVRGLSVYDGPLQTGHAMPTSTAEIGRRHRGAKGGALRAAVFGVNDGLISNASLVMGLAGAGLAPETVLLAGCAGLLAGAFSMAAGEYVSVRAQREMFEHQIGQEREELALYPAEEAEELALIYAARGLPLDEARALADRLVADPAAALDALAREELGLNPDDLGSPVGAALSSFVAFSLGAALPIAPFLFGLGGLAAPVAAAIAGLGLFAVGAAISLFSGRSALAGGARMLAIGAAAAGATFIAGRLFGVATG